MTAPLYPDDPVADGYVGRRRRAPEGIGEEVMASLVAARLAHLDGDADLCDAWHVKARYQLCDQGHTVATAMAAIHIAWPQVVVEAGRIAGWWTALTEGAE